jgi:hypothetical protein
VEPVLVDFLLEMTDEGGVDHVINLMESSNLDVAEAALLVVHRIQCINSQNHPSIRSVLRHLLKHGIIQALLRILACDSSRLFQQTVNAILSLADMMEWPLIASTVLHLIHLVPSLENLAKVIVISTVHGLMQVRFDSTHLDPSIPRLLLQLARDGMNSLDFLARILELIYTVVRHHSKLHEQFRVAGAESFLTEPQLLSCVTELRFNAQLLPRSILYVLREPRPPFLVSS